MPECDSVHTSNSGGRTSSNTARVAYSLPSASLTMRVSNTPPGRASTVMCVPRRGDPDGAPEVGEVVGVGHAAEHELARRVEDPAQTQLAGAALPVPSVPVRPQPPAGPLRAGSGAPWRSASNASSLSKRSFQSRRFVVIHSERAVERPGLQVAGPELRVAPPRDQAAALQHLEVPGDRRQRHGEGSGQLGHGGVAPGEPAHDGPPGGVRQRGEGRIEGFVSPCRHALI